MTDLLINKVFKHYDTHSEKIVNGTKYFDT